MSTAPVPPRRDVPRAGFVGMGAMACLLFCLLGTAPVVPWWLTTLLVVMWLALFARSVRWFVPHPSRLPWVAVVGFVVWLVAVAGGGALGAWR